jgi:mannobiose 2-epimerase
LINIIKSDQPMKKHDAAIIPLLLLAVTISCKSGTKKQTGEQGPSETYGALADELEESLFKYIVDRWYPLDIDTIHGGFISVLNYDWSPSERPQNKALVQQARHVWATSFLYEHYPQREEFLDYAAHGFRFLRDAMWDKEYGGFHAYCNGDGSPAARTINDKRVYGEAFAVYGLSQYYLVSRDEEALNLARSTFLWMEDHPHDPRYGGYFEMLNRSGDPVLQEGMQGSGSGESPETGLKDYNSSIHLMEALTALYRVWPDSLVRARLEEMFFLVRDTFVHPEGYLQLYFYPDWTLVPEREAEGGSGRSREFRHHFTYGHDVETAYLLLETADVLGRGEDQATHRIAKRLVDHSLESGWDTINGGFYDAGRQTAEGIEINNNHKTRWGQVEGLNALMMMHLLYPDDPNDYFGKFLKMWEYIDTYLIDKEFGGWYNAGLDTFPENRRQPKSHIWKTTYHNTRGMIHCIEMLRSAEH